MSINFNEIWRKGTTIDVLYGSLELQLDLLYLLWLFLFLSLEVEVIDILSIERFDPFRNDQTLV